MFKKFLGSFLVAALFSLRLVAMEAQIGETKPEQKTEEISLHLKSSTTEKEKSPVIASLLAEDQTIQPGHPFWVGVRLEIQEGWDTYWINPGEAGLPTQVTWHLPEGYSVSALKWPAPKLFSSQDLIAFGYGNSTMLLAQITPPSTIDLSSLDIRADVSWLACKESCVPGESELLLSLPISMKAPQKDEKSLSYFNNAREQLPAPSEQQIHLTKESKKLVLHLGSQEIKEALFIPETKDLIDYHSPQLLQKGEGQYLLQTKLLDQKSGLPDHVKGVLLVKDPATDSQKAISIDLPILSATALSSKFWTALFFAFLGGIILNVMPCVLPVIALKIMSFVKLAGEKKSELFKHGAAFTGGVLSSFWVLTALLLILRTFGQSVGWGFQLQEPLFVAILIAFLFLFSLSLFGLFEMGSSFIALEGKARVRSPLISAFLNGVLATVVATPCTGPFLGSALGFALTLPVVSSFSIFTAMGIGMALPYLLFSLFPKLLRFLPKPGNWMIVFKQIIGFVMMATLLWLLWVFASQTTLAATFILLGSLLVIALSAWIFGTWATPFRGKAVRRLAMSFSLVLLAISGGVIVTSVKKLAAGEQTEITTSASEKSDWIPFSQEKLDQLRAEGKPVFVDFTARWCLICQSNKIPLHSNEVIQAFQDKGVTLMLADWTKKSPVITEMLEKLGRSGVPLYVLYPADSQSEPLILPQTLSKTLVLDYLEQLK